jgi:DNA-binding response OmpR family regulator
MNRHLLIIENRPDQSSYFTRYFANSDAIDLTILEDSSQALAYLRELAANGQAGPDLIALSYHTGNVLEFCKYVKGSSTWSAVPVLVYTAKNSLSNMLAIYAAGANYYVVENTTRSVEFTIMSIFMRQAHRENSTDAPIFHSPSPT